MPKYSNPKQVVKASRPYQKDPREGSGGATGMWWGNQHYPGYYVDYTYADGTQETRFFYEGSGPETGATGVMVPGQSGIDAEQARDFLEDQTGPKNQTPGQQAVDAARVRQEQRDEDERQWNKNDPRGSGLLETHAERAKREAEQAREQRAQEDQAQQKRTEERQIAAQELANRQAQQRYELDVAKFNREGNEPKFLSQAGEDNPYLIRYNPASGQLEQASNPNFDAVKQQGERLRQLLSTQIQARQVTLDEAKQQYTQWFDQNVKIPMAQAQEARDRAAEQRQALDAEERRRQFAANFSLQRGELGERAGEAAMSAEQSLLPYRAGPTEAAEMSSAINSLAAGGSMANNASAGINFTPGAFQFNAPDFKQIAKDAAASALKGISTYKPSSEQYQTGDYSGVGAIGGAGPAPTIPSGYGAFSDILGQLQNTYQFGGGQGAARP